jgi:hypothetical protein
MGQAWRQPRSSAKNYYELDDFLVIAETRSQWNNATKDLHIPARRQESSLYHCRTQEPSLPSPVPAKRPESATITGVRTISSFPVPEVGLLEAIEAGGPSWEPTIVGKGQ